MLPVFSDKTVMPGEEINVIQYPGVSDIIDITFYEFLPSSLTVYQFLQMLRLDYLCRCLRVQLRSQNIPL